MFDVGNTFSFIIGYILGSHQKASSKKFESSDEAFKRREKILNYVKKPPYSNMNEIADALEIELHKVHGTLTGLVIHSEIDFVIKDNRYRLYYVL